MIEGVGTENGAPYLDIRIDGAAGSSPTGYQCPVGIAVSEGQAWTGGFMLRVLEMSPTVSMNVGVAITNAGATLYPGTGQVVEVGKTKWYSHTLAMPAGAVQSAPYFVFNGSAGAPTFVRFRLFCAQFEQALFQSDPISQANGSAVTRAIESARFSPLVEAILGRFHSAIVRHVHDQPGTMPSRTHLMGGDDIDINRIAIRAGEATTAGILFAVGNGATVVGISTAAGQSVAKGQKIGVGYAVGADGSAHSVDGQLATTGTVWSRVPQTGWYLGRTGSTPTTSMLADVVAIYPKRLSNARLQTLARAA